MIKCAILGASGLIGQQFARILDLHPDFELTNIYGSKQRKGQKFKECWNLPFFNFPNNLDHLVFENLDKLFDQSNFDFDIAFSGLPADIANKIEPYLREKGIKIFSNASAFRMDPEVPIMIPEINEKHIELVENQIEKYDGFIITNANCSVTGAALYLDALSKYYDYDNVVISTYQALSGAGNNGVNSLSAVGNVIPFIKNEEEKIPIEANKILGSVNTDNKTIKDKGLNIIANCARVPVIDGHLEAITVFGKQIDFDSDELKNKLNSTKNSIYKENILLSPRSYIKYIYENDRPQPKYDVFLGDKEINKGMVLSVGRLKTQSNTVSSYILVHNTIRGGAGGSVLNAEIAKNRGLI